MSDLEQKNAKATRESTVLGILARHCGESLTPNKIEMIVEELCREMNDSPVSWAFQFKDE